jgi:RimJ/RimL family protein N-acetyltransferase
MLVPTISTARLRLRPYELSDVAELTRLIGAREVAENLLRVPYPYREQDARNFILSIKEGAEASFAITLAGDQNLIGGLGLRIDSEHPRAELGYWLGTGFWGRGYATEGARAVVEYGFATLGLHRIYASAFRENTASAKVLQKLGMTHEGCLRQHALKWGRFVDLEMYAILRCEWKQ